ncbi:lytic polysaccharide monooxygenase [Curvularia clavata]|uniref:Lytic polysaccharide monooxygenase n=1 Tax=Curvularia clavata TaxID=95742 RepID=A0A9Q8ZI81_CURCL|nr:lytic polysaccharide monooxygenase [Curvularia clavata]
MSIRSTLMAAAIFFASANSHIIMEQPVPYSVDKIDNSPITQSQFPCKSQNGFTVSQMNKMAVGEQQTIKFKGTAVHGGGSCQLSVTMDTEPTANSKFKVIKSIEGGCPGVDGQTSEYNFEIPKSVPNGKATFAWTWFSKMSGAPELYMNCAPIEVTGGASDDSAFNELPDMFVANINEGCTSPQNFATKFPNPGQDVQKGSTNDLKDPTGSCGATGSTPADPSSPSGGSPSSAPSSPAGGAPSAVPSSPAGGASPSGTTPPVAGQPSVAPTSAVGGKPSAAPAPSNGGGVFAPGASSGSPAGPTGAPALPSTSTTLVTVTATPTAPVRPTPPLGTGSPAAPTAPSTGGGSGTPSTPSTGGGSGTCSQNGAIVCNGSTQFGICNNGNVVWQAVASGTTCSNGVISKRAYHGRVVRPRLSNRRVAN